MQNFFLIIALVLIGMGLRRLPAFPRDTANVINQFVIYVSLPAMILLKVPTLTFSRTLLVPALMPWLLLLFSAAVILLLARVLGWGRATTGCLLLVIPLGNTSFLGIPMVEAFFGSPAVPVALIYDQLGSFLALSTYGALIVGLYRMDDDRPDAGRILINVVTFPPFIALVIAVGFKMIPCPPVAVRLFETLAATLVPLTMIVVGYQLVLRMSRALATQLTLGLGIKLVVMPLAALGVCRWLGFEGEAVDVSVFEAAMPPMVTAGAMAMLAGLSSRLAAALVGVGLVVSFVTLPLLFHLLHYGG